MKYVILRDPQRRPAYGDRREVSFRGQPGESPELPMVEVGDLNVRERRDMGGDPMVRDRIAALVPTRLIEPRYSTADNEGGDSWGITAVGADVSTFTGAGTRVAVLDTGIDRAHPAFAGMNIEEKDFSGRGNGDKHGHGTHCAGTIFGRDVDGSRIGVARGVQDAMIGKILRDDGAGDSAAICDGIMWAVRQGAQVISLSVGLDFPRMLNERVAAGRPTDVALSSVLEAYRENLRLFDSLMANVRALEAWGTGCVVVAAAGNESHRPEYEVATSLPAAADRVLSTGAIARSPDGFVIAPYSNTFPKLCAPGSGIKSASPGGGLLTSSGTSMACPHAAGVTALWWEKTRTVGVTPAADSITSRVRAQCRTDGFAPGMHSAVYGDGLVTAP